MNDFEISTDRACDVIDALRVVLTYPIGDNERYLSMRLFHYSDSVMKENSPYSGDRARDSLNKVLLILSTYLRNPTGDNYLWLTNALIDFKASTRAYVEEARHEP